MPTPPAPAITIPAKAGAVRIGNDLPVTFLCGPCAMESREHALETAEFLKGVFAKAGAGFVYKTSFDKANRSSLTGKRGAGLDYAAPVFEDIRGKLGVPVMTDIHLPDHCADVASVVDVLQIPAFLCRQTDLLIAAAKTGKPINVKKGQFLAPWDMKNVIAKITDSGNPNVMACERGASFGYNTLISDMRALPIMKSFGAPVVFDATHSVQQPGGKGESSGGERQYVPVLARAAVAIGVAAVFIESHPDPDNAPSDGPNMVPFAELPALVADLVAFDRLAKSAPAA
jgi:2-dehydro-3-deoxyphosphooctonate aldolase (KDO 8-P synthase)